jgi:microcystin-dependent protein
MSQGRSVFVGAVLPYAGKLSATELNAIGWMVCDGQPLKVKENPELFAAIGTSSGGDGNTSFNIPNYEGYFLRGLDKSSTVDPDAGARTAAQSGGATGAQPGTVQGWATGLPVTPFHARVPHVPSDDHDAYSGTGPDMLVDSDPQTFSSNGGGDKESRPTNAYVRFIIATVDGVALPTAAVIAYAGDIPDQSGVLAKAYRACDGQPSSSATGSPDEALFAAIGYTHGGDGQTTFNRPDYRGRFLRGVDPMALQDPDADARLEMQPGGSTGRNTGSVQPYATAPPKNPYTISVAIGSDDKFSSTSNGHDNSMYTNTATNVAFTASGGDRETRPVNIGVDYFIFAEVDPQTVDVIPAGAVVAFPAELETAPTQWLRCDGSPLNSDPKGEYGELFAAIGYSNGGSGGLFNLPDYQGYFLRGTDHQAGHDPDAATRVAPVTTTTPPSGCTGDHVGSKQGSATGQPASGPITGPIGHMPTADEVNAAAIWCSTVAEWDGEQDPQVGGGDKESRPCNAAVDFYIKYAVATA